ncbi:MAG: hypothetical protein ABIJ00_07930 [Candidatus Eisenbacteria bacterium]
MAVGNKVAIRYKDGKVAKGTTHDFVPGRPVFHIQSGDSSQPSEVKMDDLKAIFFVKDFSGKPDYSETKKFPDSTPASKGRKIAVLFNDGELLTGYTLAYDPRRPGFFVMPTDEMSNNDRAYVVRSAVKDVGMGPQADEILKKNLPA